MAIDPTNPARVLVAWQDLRQAGTCLPGYALSSDGGITWVNIGQTTAFSTNPATGTASLSILGYEHGLNEPAILQWNDRSCAVG